MLGLKRHTVHIVDYDPLWPTIASMTITGLQDALHGAIIDIQHIGSTAVPGLAAKPVIDLAILVSTGTPITSLMTLITPLGWLYVQGSLVEVGHLFVFESVSEIRTHHLHVVENHDNRWNDYISFRDALRADAALRDRYAQIKQSLAAGHQSDRQAYTDGKGDFVRATVAHGRG